jgi:hypothetical protein
LIGQISAVTPEKQQMENETSKSTQKPLPNKKKAAIKTVGSRIYKQ